MLIRRDSDDMREIRPRVYRGAFIVVCALVVLLVRLFQLQISRGDDYAYQSINNYKKSLFVPADRGVIKDRHGAVLVDNRPSFDVFLTPAFCKGKEKAEVMAHLAQLLKLAPEDVEHMQHEYDRAMNSKDKLERFRPYLVSLDIPRDFVDVLEAHRQELSCVDLIPTPHRNYNPAIAAGLGHILGYMSEVTPDEMDATDENGQPLYRRGQTIGRRGLERRWEKELRGEDGKENVVVDAKGRRLDEAMNEMLITAGDRFVPATPGKNLILSLDARLQKAADEAFPGRAGAVVVLEAQTGFVLALVSRPSFDPNKMSGRISRAELKEMFEDPLKPMLNRAMNENYHPGSTFKVVTSLAGLERGLLTERSSLSCGGHFTLGGHTWRCDKPQGHGGLDVRRALQVSCDVFYYRLGDMLGLDPISQMAHMLGYGQPTGFDIGNRENPGNIPDSDSVLKVYGFNGRGHAINASIGQGGVDVTPLQQAVAYAAVANGGFLYKPQIVRRIETGDGHIEQEFGPLLAREGRLPIKPENLQLIREALTLVVNKPGGTAYRSRLPDIQFAGKTGTAQVIKLGAKQNNKTASIKYWSRDHAWFAAFAPADKPEIVVVVLNEHGGWGAETAAPPASRIIRAWLDLKSQDTLAEELKKYAPAQPQAQLPVQAVPAKVVVGN
jgi:penicillin-binding protein 2